MVILESWSPVGRLQESLKGTGQVNKAVAHEEEHGQKWSENVDVAEQDTALADAHSQDKSPGKTDSLTLWLNLK